MMSDFDMSQSLHRNRHFFSNVLLYKVIADAGQPESRTSNE